MTKKAFYDHELQQDSVIQIFRIAVALFCREALV